jgi:hypothetical protein
MAALHIGVIEFALLYFQAFKAPQLDAPKRSLITWGLPGGTNNEEIRAKKPVGHEATTSTTSFHIPRPSCLRLQRALAGKKYEKLT